MRYLMLEILVSLIIAAVIGFVIGWLLKHLFCKRKLSKIEAAWSGKYHQLESEAGGLRGQLSDRDAAISKLQSGGGDGGGEDGLRAELKKAEARLVEVNRDLEACRAGKTSAPAPATPSSPAPAAVSGDKPAWLLSSPSEGDPDDLKKIWGVGPVLEKTMNTLGIYYYRQVAKFTDPDVEWVADNINAFPDRIKRDRWIEQAQDLHKTKYGSEP